MHTYFIVYNFNKVSSANHSSGLRPMNIFLRFFDGHFTANTNTMQLEGSGSFRYYMGSIDVCRVCIVPIVSYR